MANSDWKEYSLGELVDVLHGYAFQGRHFSDEPTENILLTPGNFNIGGGFKANKFKYYKGDVPEDYILVPGEVIVTMTDLSKEADTLGYSAIVPKIDGKKLLHNQRLGRVKLKSDKADLNFLNWVMRTDEYRWHILGSASGSTVSHTSPYRIKDYRFKLPPLQEQCAIAAVLSSLDDKIDLLHRQNKTLESLASTIWRKMFIEEAGSKWENGRLSDVADVNPYRELKKGTMATYLDMSNMPTTGLFPLDWESREYSGGMKFKNGDTLVARITPCLENGKTAYVNFLNDGEVAAGSTEYVVLSPKKSNCAEWLYFLARHDDFRDFAIQNMTGTSGRQRVSGETIAQYEIAIPPSKAFEEFHAFAGPVVRHIKQNSTQIRALSKARAMLLPKLMSGEVKV